MVLNIYKLLFVFINILEKIKIIIELKYSLPALFEVKPLKINLNTIYYLLSAFCLSFIIHFFKSILSVNSSNKVSLLNLELHN